MCSFKRPFTLEIFGAIFDAISIAIFVTVALQRSVIFWRELNAISLEDLLKT